MILQDLFYSAVSRLKDWSVEDIGSETKRGTKCSGKFKESLKNETKTNKLLLFLRKRLLFLQKSLLTIKITM